MNPGWPVLGTFVVAVIAGSATIANALISRSGTRSIRARIKADLEIRKELATATLMSDKAKMDALVSREVEALTSADNAESYRPKTRGVSNISFILGGCSLVAAYVFQNNFNDPSRPPDHAYWVFWTAVGAVVCVAVGGVLRVFIAASRRKLLATGAG